MEKIITFHVSPTSDMTKKVKEIEDEFIRLRSLYLEANEKLAEYEGKDVKDVGYDRLLQMINDIQKAFLSLWPFIDLVLRYHKIASNTLEAYKDMIETLKSQGVKFGKETTGEA